ncbi:MAG TPA: polysaccharide pyruvyl transferase family protein [Arachidicoccus sp.]|nr:polysaccharide pyruvyl transferase family protein [Arachidicoccus sp.]
MKNKDLLKITIKGAYGETNFGDDLLMVVFEKYFKTVFPSAEINFWGTKIGYVKQLLDSTSKYNETSFESDWLVYGGGTQFFSFSNHTLTTIEKLKLVLRNPSLLITKFKRQPFVNYNKVAFLGFGIGPFTGNSQVINGAKERLQNADYIGVRDEVSYIYCQEWNINAVLGADVVFSSFFKINEYLVERNFKGDQVKKKLGIIIRDWGLDEDGDLYIEKIMEFYKSTEDFESKFIIFAPHKDPKFMDRLKDENILVWDPDKYTLSDFIAELNLFDIFISARYHGAIVAALLNKPVICIEIEDKLKILSQQIPELKLWKKPFLTSELELILENIDKTPDYRESLSHLNQKADLMLENFYRSIS